MQNARIPIVNRTRRKHTALKRISHTVHAAEHATDFEISFPIISTKSTVPVFVDAATLKITKFTFDLELAVNDP